MDLDDGCRLLVVSTPCPREDPSRDCEGANTFDGREAGLLAIDLVDGGRLVLYTPCPREELVLYTPCPREDPSRDCE